MNKEVQQMIQRLRLGYFCQICDDYVLGGCVRSGGEASCKIWEDIHSVLDLLESLNVQLERARQNNNVLHRAVGAERMGYDFLKIERDALLADLKEAAVMDCSICKYYAPDDGRCEKADFVCRDCSLKDCPCRTCEAASNWEWRGVKTDDEAGD